MPKLLQINVTANRGSTGRIAEQIGEKVIAADWESYIAYGRDCGKSKSQLVKIGSRLGVMWHALMTRITDKHGLYSKIATHRLIRQIERINPDIIHLHNIHGYYINYKVLFDYLQRSNVPVVWTLHDCWTFTGHCPYFDIVGCEKWKTECHDCEQCSVYPEIKIDTSRMMHRKKKEWFSGFRDLTLVTPSQWLSGCAKESFLREYPIKVINNGIDLSVFKPIESNFREKWNIPDDKQILLGVSFGWGERKGLDVFIELEKRLDPDKYQIVLVGTDENVDASLPEGIISIHRTNDQIELAEIYTATDLFVNPTREEVFGLVNVEALACGTPVVTFRSGGSPECIDDTCGIVVEKNDVDAMEQAILYITKDKPFSAESCMAYAENFDMQQRFADYIKLYEQIMDDKAGLTNEQ